MAALLLASLALCSCLRASFAELHLAVSWPTEPRVEEVNSDMWVEGAMPAMDGLDRFMAYKTGCSYDANSLGMEYVLSDVLEAAPLYRRMGLRMPGVALVRLNWGDSADAEERHGVETSSTGWLKITTGALSGDYYTMFYLEIDAGLLRFGKEEDEEPLVERTVTLARGLPITMTINEPWSRHGSKLLHNCPEEEADEPRDQLCDATVGGSARHPTPRGSGAVPLRDDLDTYMINATGCAFTALMTTLHVPAAPYGGRFLLRGAVRARAPYHLHIGWGSGAGYDFEIGEKNNTVWRVKEWLTNFEWEYATPAPLSEDRYVPFYVKIVDGELWFSVECDVWLRNPVSLSSDQLVYAQLQPRAPSGGKLLHHCPDY